MGVVLGLCFGRKGREVRELLLSDVSSASFSEGSMRVESAGNTFTLESAGDEEGLRTLVEELQKAF